MKKSDLKDGMLVQLRNGSVYLHMSGMLYRQDGWETMDIFCEDLTSKHSVSMQYDIIRVSNILSGTDLIPHYWNCITLDKNLLWERTVETIEIDGAKYNKHEVKEAIKNLNTVEEIC